MISLCMIVRDEAELLPSFLAHAQGAWDELVVVDTGSRDPTVTLLEEAGARVLSRPWDDDFSAARNAGLSLARGEWILVLDADERVSADLVGQIRALAADASAGAATIRMVNPLPHGKRREARLLRLFRRDETIRFRHPIHEDVADSLSDYLKREGLALRHLSGEVTHLGYVRERAAAKDKKARDERLLRHCLAREPGDLYCWFKLLELARFWSDAKLWRRAAHDARAALARAAPQALRSAHFGGELAVLVAQGRFDPQSRPYLDFLEKMAGKVAPSPALMLARGEALERRGESASAAASFRRCLELSEAPGDLQLATTRPLLGLARLALAARDLASAQAYTLAALEHDPADPEALLAAAALARARGGAAEVARFAQAHRRAHPEASGLALALGDEAMLAGDLTAAQRHLCEAAGTPPTGTAALRLAQVRLEAGDLDGARTLALSLTGELPQAGLGVLVCDLAQGRNSDLELDLDPDEAWSSMRGWIEALWRASEVSFKTRFLANAPAIRELFPRLPALLGHLQPEWPGG
jgi:tetratricopeptide (TPR) repeat protein